MTESTALIIYNSPKDRPTTVALMEGATVLLERSKKYLGVVIQTDSDAELIGELRARINDQAKKLDDDRLELTAGLRAKVKELNDEVNSTYILPLQADLKKLDASITAFFAKKKADADAAAKEKARVEQEAQAAAAAALKAQQEAEAKRVAAEQLAAEATTEADKVAAQQLVQEAAQQSHDAAVDVAAAAHTLDVAASAPVAPAARRSVTGIAGSFVGMRDNWIAEVTDAKLVPEEYLIAPIDRVDMKLLNAKAKSQKANASVPGVVFKNVQVPNSRVGK